jgi:hypothetical protein
MARPYSRPKGAQAADHRAFVAGRTPKHWFVEWKEFGRNRCSKLFRGKKIAQAQAFQIAHEAGVTEVKFCESDGFGHVTRSDFYALN